jgi:hypothetical protein
MTSSVMRPSRRTVISGDGVVTDDDVTVEDHGNDVIEEYHAPAEKTLNVRRTWKKYVSGAGSDVYRPYRVS